MAESNQPEPMTDKLAQAESHVKRNIVPANDSLIVCGDGRYTEQQKNGGIGIFGGDLGVIMAAKEVLSEKGIPISAKQLIADYYRGVKQVRGEDAKINCHTDSHHDLPGVGCGHAAHASSEEDEGKYGSLKPEEAKELWDEVTKSDFVDWTVLHGEHKEDGVLLVKEEPGQSGFTVNPSDELDMFFVVDVDRANKYMDKLAAHLGIPGLSADDLKKSYLKQMTATAKLLAKGKPQYDVTFDITGAPKIAFAGNVPTE